MTRRTNHRSTVALSALALATGLAGLTLPSAVAESDGPEAVPVVTWEGDPTWIGGTSTYDGAEWIHTDFVYDDYGANTCTCAQPNVVSLGGTTGDYRYPDGAAISDNAADILEVRVRPDGDGVAVRVRLNTILDASVPALYVRAASADGTVLYDEVVTHRRAGVVVDVAANTVAFGIDGPVGDTVSLLVGAGLHDGEGALRRGVVGNANLMPDEFTTGGPAADDAIVGALFDLAFNTEAHEGRGGPWNEDAQSAALAAGDVSDFSATVDLAALRAGDGPAFELSEGYHVAIHESAQGLGEGTAGSFPQYLGDHQPYALWIPAGYAEMDAAPFFLSMHSLSSFHNQYRGGDAPSASYPTYYEQLGDDIGAIVATPLSRGPDGWYEAEGLIETLEVWADVLDRFRVDQERVYAGGYSMGGYGTYRLTTMMPDAFASAAVMSGPMTNGIWAYPLPPEVDGREDRPDNTYHQLESTLHVPTSMKHGTNDELVPVAGVVHHTQRYAELGHEYQFNLFAGHDHLSFVFSDGWEEEAAWLLDHPTRRVDPRRVTLDIRPSTWVEGVDEADRATHLDQLRALTAEVGADIDGGYWIDGVVPRTTEGDATAEVDLSSHGITSGHEPITPLPQPGATTSNGAYSRFETIQAPRTFAAADALSGSLRNVERLTIDVDRAGISFTPDVSGLQTDGLVQLELVGANGYRLMAVGG